MVKTEGIYAKQKKPADKIINLISGLKNDSQATEIISRKIVVAMQGNALSRTEHITPIITACYLFADSGLYWLFFTDLSAVLTYI
ncbi:MAG: hypothetical protein U9R57_15945 [Thermodesulfobacteriota bacterium]|nr:hypothetical protein [Thermodesulfobacteriota bacterium]